MGNRKPYVYAYKMLKDGYHEAPIAIVDTPKNICAFVASREPLDSYILTDIGDNFILSTMGSFLDRVNETVDLQELHRIIIPMQMGDTEIPEVEKVDFESYEYDLEQDIEL